MQRSEQIGDLILALSKAQADFTPALKTSTNSYFSSKYADLGATIDSVRPALNKQGIAIIQLDESDLERQTATVTTALHMGEQFISISVEAPATSVGKDGKEKFNVQTLGACWTYLRRYTLQAICGLASEDDDGNSVAVDAKPIAKKVEPTTAPDVRTSFFATAKKCGWGLADIKGYLQDLFNESSTAKLAPEQLADTLEAFAHMTPAQYAEGKKAETNDVSL